MSDFPGGEIEILGRAMTRDELRIHQAAGAEKLAGKPSWDNPNYIPIEELVGQELLKQEPLFDWDDDTFDDEDDFDYDEDDD